MSSWIYSFHLMVLLLCMSCRSYCWYLKNRGVTISVLYLSAIRTHGPCFSFLKTEASPVASVKHFRSLNQKYRKMSKRSSKLKAGLAILHIYFFSSPPFQTRVRLACVRGKTNTFARCAGNYLFNYKFCHLATILWVFVFITLFSTDWGNNTRSDHMALWLRRTKPI